MMAIPICLTIGYTAALFWVIHRLRQPDPKKGIYALLGISAVVTSAAAAWIWQWLRQ